MSLYLARSSFEIGRKPGLLLVLHSDGERIGSAELMLPAEDHAVHNALDTLIAQASRHGVRIGGAKRLALFHEIEMGAVA